MWKDGEATSVCTLDERILQRVLTRVTNLVCFSAVGGVEDLFREEHPESASLGS